MVKHTGILVALNCILLFSNGEIIIEGDVVIAGLFGIYEPNGEKCNYNVDVSSVMTVEAVKWYIQQLNEFGQLPFRIGFESFETCWLNSQAALHAVEILNRAQRNETIIGVIGPDRSSEAQAISHILGAVPKRNQLVQVSFSATAPDLGNDKVYPNFIRVVPNDEIQVEMIVKSMMKLEWNRVAVVYEDTVYGQAVYARLQSRTEMDGICIALARTIMTNVGINANDISQILEDIIIGKPQSRPAINGIVLIASASVAKVVMSSLDMSQFSSIPIIMLSEGTNMDENVFRRYNEDVITKARGTLVLAPPYTDVTEFTQHWNSIFTNATKFDTESASNPWLRKVFYKVTNCVKQNCDFRVLTNAEVKSSFRQQPLFVSYAITAAHALIKAVTSLRAKFCPAQQNSCGDFLSNFHSGDMVTVLKGTEMHFKTDFAWSPASLENEILAIDHTGEVTMQEDVSSYELFNVQPGNTRSEDIKFEKIGMLTNDEEVIDFNKIRDYDALGQEIRWPDVRKSQCSTGQKCSECIPLKELQEDVLHEPGDVYIIGVMPVFQKSGVQECGEISVNSGYQLAESIRFAVQKINKKTGDYSNFFPGIQIGLIVINSCSNPAVVQRKIYELHKNGISLGNGTVIDVTDKVMGYVAEYTSTVSISIAQILSVLQYVQISYASTSPALSDRGKFPYFMRVVTPDDAQAKAMVEIMKKLNANYVQIIYSAGAYGGAGRDKVKEAAEDNKICVVQDIPINEDDSLFQIYDKLRKYAQAKIVIAFLYPNILRKLVRALTTQMKRGEFVFIGSESWARETFVLAEDKNNVMLGSLTVSLEMYQDRELRNHVQNIKAKPYRTDPWAQIFIQAKRNCYFDLSFDKTQAAKCSSDNDYSVDPDFTLDTYDTQAYVATKSLLAGADAFMKKQCGTTAKSLCKDFTRNAKGLTEEIRKVREDLDGSGSKMKVFNVNGDGNVGYRIYNIQKDDVDSSRLIYREVGRYPLEGTFTFEKERLVHPAGVTVNSRCPNKQACTSCFKESDKPPDMPSGEAKDYMLVVIALGSTLAIVAVVSVVLIVLLCRQRRKRRDDGNDLCMRPRVPKAESDFTQPREDTTPSKIYFEIPSCSHERRYVPMDTVQTAFP